jgi:hypothetical protein
MTPADKAKELVDKFKHNTRAFNETNGWEDTLHDAKECALIAVDEVLNMVNYQVMFIDLKSLDVIYSYEYWEQVKIEIEKI